MTFIKTVSEGEATGSVKTMYQQAKDNNGYVPNMVKAFSYRPKVMGAWSELLASIKSTMDPRRYELVTLAAAQTLHSSYCMLAHGSILLRDFYSSKDLQSIVSDIHSSNLDEADKAILQFVQKVVDDATAVNTNDVEDLRDQGLSDEEIFDIVAAAAARCFFSKTLDALGIQPDPTYNVFEENLKHLLTVGRPIDDPHVDD